MTQIVCFCLFHQHNKDSEQTVSESVTQHILLVTAEWLRFSCLRLLKHLRLRFGFVLQGCCVKYDPESPVWQNHELEGLVVYKTQTAIKWSYTSVPNLILLIAKTATQENCQIIPLFLFCLIVVWPTFKLVGLLLTRPSSIMLILSVTFLCLRTSDGGTHYVFFLHICTVLVNATCQDYSHWISSDLAQAFTWAHGWTD